MGNSTSKNLDGTSLGNDFFCRDLLMTRESAAEFGSLESTLGCTSVFGINWPWSGWFLRLSRSQPVVKSQIYSIQIIYIYILCLSLSLYIYIYYGASNPFRDEHEYGYFWFNTLPCWFLRACLPPAPTNSYQSFWSIQCSQHDYVQMW